MKSKVSLIKTILFTVCSILVLDSFATLALIGVSSISIRIISAVFFFLPYGLISAKPGSTYPDDGGIAAYSLLDPDLSGYGLQAYLP